MARRKKSSPLEDVLDLLAMLPWWVCLVLAAVSYFLLHRLAVPIQTSDIQGQGGAMVGAMMQKAIIHGLANAGQYIVPLLCIAAAALSAWRRKQRQALVSDVAQARNADALDGMSWQEFELLVGEAYRLQGYRVAEIGGGGPDGGVDLVLAKGSEKFLVQCKQWKAYKVGVTTVRELYGVMAAKGATGGFVVTSGRFTSDAKDFAQGRNIELVDGPRLFAMIQQARGAQGKPAAAQREIPSSMGSPAPHPQSTIQAPQATAKAAMRPEQYRVYKHRFKLSPRDKAECTRLDTELPELKKRATTARLTPAVDCPFTQNSAHPLQGSRAKDDAKSIGSSSTTCQADKLRPLRFKPTLCHPKPCCRSAVDDC